MTKSFFIFLPDISITRSPLGALERALDVASVFGENLTFPLSVLSFAALFCCSRLSSTSFLSYPHCCRNGCSHSFLVIFVVSVVLVVPSRQVEPWSRLFVSHDLLFDTTSKSHKPIPLRNSSHHKHFYLSQVLSFQNEYFKTKNNGKKRNSALFHEI